MTDYAMIRYENNTVRKIVKNKKPHPNARPVEYPKLDVTNLTHDINEAPLYKWEVLENKVIAKYDIKKKDFEKEKEKALSIIDFRIKQKYNNYNINYKNFDIIIDQKCIERLLLKKTILELDKEREINWKINNHILRLKYNDIIDLLTLIDNKLNEYFDKYSEIVESINMLKNDDFQGLSDIKSQYF